MRIIIYKPLNDANPERTFKIENMLKAECEKLGIELVTKTHEEDYLLINLESEGSETLLYIEDDDSDTVENIEAMIKVLILIESISSKASVKTGSEEIIELKNSYLRH